MRNCRLGQVEPVNDVTGADRARLCGDHPQYLEPIRIRKRLELAGATIALREKDLSEYSARQRQLFDGLSEGVITLDLASTITSINEAARAIMGLSQLDSTHFVGKPLKQVFFSSTG